MARVLRKPFVLMLGGTSLTTGRLSTPPYSWAMRLEAAMRANAACVGELRILNTGQGSQTSNFGATQAARMAALRPSHVLMEDFGINDCAIGPVSIPQATINFNAMVASYRAANPNVIIAHQTMSSATAGDASRVNLASYYDNGLANAVLNGIPSLDNYYGTALTPGGWPKPLPYALTVGSPGVYIPAGFSVLDLGTIWNAADKSATITLTNGALTTTQTVGAWSAARATTSKTAGKWYFQVRSDISPYIIIGIGTAAMTLASYVGSDANAYGYFFNDGTVKRAGATIDTVSPIAEGGTGAVAFDLDNNKIWFLNGGGFWNNSPTANPATNTGGIAIAAGTYFPAISLFDVGDQATTAFEDSGDALHPIWENAFQIYSYPNIAAWMVQAMRDYWP